ncbi:MAG: ATP-binding cassette domain-containing protein [Bifidobacterium tibiigranuli]|jgi:osmoprotectant transport system ATP-binding protein|uniref:ABC transporter ATP-binding protein n=1 Tax=Bifidobacterium tibiigranuli TaxID=2172043 RepID=UPI0026EF75BC|nr:ATP-binding cassette domain-containing protein [Bifidobacterium tibiigranuli]MCI1673025.1 ATP-binding cassette domain-containing protein [Bifidobacterium tibiigranuli]MCI1713125.1 ATP-binding cassette domain-containing protein [Bifidobacterium tibiigranuli]MCI1834889.1 ATP-binding cassette domain-containing protein [Bifidobacterium tibiigranuli]
MIEFVSVTKQYDNGTIAVNDVSFTAPTGKITVLVGPSGCGKTTSLRMINRLIEPTQGRILLGGIDSSETDVIQMRRAIGYVIQNAGLFPHRKVIDNIVTVPMLSGKDKKASYEHARELLDIVGLGEEYAERYPWQLSGGQQQRVGVARALAADPSYMLMDEPFSAVDPIVRKQLQDEFLRIQKTFAKTIVLVTHDIAEALKLGDYIAVFQEGGHLVQFSEPAELLRHPANHFVSDFLGTGRGYEELSFVCSEMPISSVGTIRIGDNFGPSTGGEWLVACNEEGKAVGWVHSDGRSACEADAIAYTATVREGVAPLKEYLDAVLASPCGVAIVERKNGADWGAIHSSDVMGRLVGRAEESAEKR